MFSPDPPTTLSILSSSTSHPSSLLVITYSIYYIQKIASYILHQFNVVLVHHSFCPRNIMGFDISKPGLRLGLGLGLHDDHSSENCMKTNEQSQRQRQSQKKKETDPCNKAYPSLKLGPPDDEANNNNQQITNIESDEYYYFHPHASSRSPSAVSSFSNSSSIIKREREQLELEVEKISLSRDFVDVDENGNPKKKLRLTKEQSAVLEDSFKEHYTISPVCYISKLINK